MASTAGRIAYTVANDTGRDEVEASIRAVLVAIRPKLTTLYVDLISDTAWPQDALVALALLGGLRTQQRRRLRPITVEVDPADDEQFAAALMVVPHSIGATGITDDEREAFSADDTGRSTWFELTGAEVEVARAAIRSSGLDSAILRPVLDR